MNLRQLSLTLVAACIAATSILVATFAPPVGAGGGTWLYGARDRYEPGEQVTLVAYVGNVGRGWIEDGPFDATLRLAPVPLDRTVEDPDAAELPLGPLTLQETGRGHRHGLRASITFDLPADLAPGLYGISYGTASGTSWLGDLVGGEVWVGVDPAYPIHRGWPADDPALTGAPAWVPLPPAPPPPPTTAPPASDPAPTTTTNPTPTTSATTIAPPNTRTPAGEETSDLEVVSAVQRTGSGPSSSSGVPVRPVAVIGALLAAAIGATVLGRRAHRRRLSSCGTIGLGRAEVPSRWAP